MIQFEVGFLMNHSKPVDGYEGDPHKIETYACSFYLFKENFG